MTKITAAQHELVCPALAAERQVSWRAWAQDSVLEGATHSHKSTTKAKLPAPPLQTPSVFAELKSQAATWSQQWRSCPEHFRRSAKATVGLAAVRIPSHQR